MGNRPAGDPALWAEADDTFSSGAYSGQPNKVDPSQGIIDRGFYPDRDLPAGWLNWILNDVTLRAAYLDLVDVLNWDPADNSIEVASSVESPYALIWHPFARAYVVVQDAAGALEVRYSPDAKTNWLQVTIAGTPDFGEALAMSPVTGGVLVLERSTGVMHYLSSPDLTATTPGATFSNFTVTGAVGGIDNTAPFIVFGQDSSNNRPKLYTVTEGPVAATKRDLTNEASLNTAVLAVAVGADRVVAISLAGHVWYYVGSGAGTWLAANSGTPITANPQGLSYDEVNGVFWTVDNDGTVFTSADGVSWVEGVDLDVEFSGSIISFNGIWIAQGTHDGTSVGGARLFFSTDMGVTWEDIPAPLGGWVAICSEAGRRLVAIDAAGLTSRSLRTR